jgi:hypothetical protein
MGPSFSASYDFYPYSKLRNPSTEPINGERNFEQDLEIRIATLNIRANYPTVLSPNRTFLIHEISFDRFDIDYNNWNTEQAGTESQPENVFAIKYNLLLRHMLTQKWSLMAFIVPGLASDFESKISFDDFTFETAVVFIRQYSERLSWGIGLAYSRFFGEPLPMPVLALEWNNGSNMKSSIIIPVSLEYWYRMIPALDLGFIVGVQGNQYHGNPDKYLVDNPQLRYSVTTVGPAANIRLKPWFKFRFDAGFNFLRRFEFFDGNEKARSLNLENAGFVRIGLQLEAGE